MRLYEALLRLYYTGIHCLACQSPHKKICKNPSKKKNMNRYPLPRPSVSALAPQTPPNRLTALCRRNGLRIAAAQQLRQRTRQHTSAYASIRQHMPASAYASIRQHAQQPPLLLQQLHLFSSIREHTPAYASICSSLRRCCNSCTYLVSYALDMACGLLGRIRQHTSAYVSIRQHTSAYAFSGTYARYGMRIAGA